MGVDKNVMHELVCGKVATYILPRGVEVNYTTLYTNKGDIKNKGEKGNRDDSGWCGGETKARKLYIRNKGM